MKKNGSTPRQSSIHRATKETDILVEWTLDGSGQGTIDTGIRFFDHMLELLSKHGFFDLTVQAKGDIDIDEHHTVEDVGIVMGQALHQALGEKAGIKRFGFASAPLDETLAQVTVDLSGRPYLVYNVKLTDRKIKAFDLGLFEDFFQAFVTHGGLESPRESHVRPQPTPHHGSHLQGVRQSFGSSHDAGREVGRKGALYEGDAVACRGSCHRSAQPSSHPARCRDPAAGGWAPRSVPPAKSPGK